MPQRGDGEIYHPRKHVLHVGTEVMDHPAGCTCRGCQFLAGLDSPVATMPGDAEVWAAVLRASLR
jgi:hypothetical protein